MITGLLRIFFHSTTVLVFLISYIPQHRHLFISPFLFRFSLFFFSKYIIQRGFSNVGGDALNLVVHYTLIPHTYYTTLYTRPENTPVYIDECVSVCVCVSVCAYVRTCVRACMCAGHGNDDERIGRSHRGFFTRGEGTGLGDEDNDRVVEWCHFNPSNGSFVLCRLFMKRNDFSSILM